MTEGRFKKVISPLDIGQAPIKVRVSGEKSGEM